MVDLVNIALRETTACRELHNVEMISLIVQACMMPSTEFGEECA